MLQLVFVGVREIRVIRGNKKRHELHELVEGRGKV